MRNALGEDNTGGKDMQQADTFLLGPLPQGEYTGTSASSLHTSWCPTRNWPVGLFCYAISCSEVLVLSATPEQDLITILCMDTMLLGMLWAIS